MRKADTSNNVTSNITIAKAVNTKKYILSSNLCTLNQSIARCVLLTKKRVFGLDVQVTQAKSDD